MGAKIETDFDNGLSGSTGTANLRLRQAYMTLAKDGLSIKFGQAWHPLAADLPDVLSLNSGAPFNPFSRTPLLNVDYRLGDRLTLNVYAIWQMQYTSAGPVEGAESGVSYSADFIKYGCTPEFFLGLSYSDGGGLVRIGADLLSIKATDNALYMLDTSGTLYTSTDATTWTAAGGTYSAILGDWNGCMLLVSKEGDTYYHDKYPRPEGFTPTPVPASFPVQGMSEMLIYSSSWMTAPQGMIVGGRLADGTLTGAMWGYDGTTWALLSNDMPPRQGAMLFSYVTFIVDDNWVTTEQTAWFVIGGENDQEMLNDVWLTTNYGVSWKEADLLMQMPAYIMPRAYASVIICEESNDVLPAEWHRMDEPSLPEGYRAMPLRTASSEQLVPYIYMFGGMNREGNVYDQIWRGVINRLRFEPIP